MAAPTVDEIMLGLETRLKTISGLRTNSYMADQINPPHAVVGLPESVNYHSTMGKGKQELDINVMVLVSNAIDRAGSKKLGQFADAATSTSIALAIEGDRTLGGKVDDCIVHGFRVLRTEEVGALGFYGGVFSIRVVAAGV